MSLAAQATVVSDVAGTSGVHTQAFSTSVLQTIRKTLSKLEVSGYVPGLILVHPNGFENIELALSTVNAVDHLSLPFDAAARRLWETPLVVSTAVTAGVSYTVAAGAVGLNTDSQGVQVAWSETSNADDWSKNMVRARCEGRYATSVCAARRRRLRSDRLRTLSVLTSRCGEPGLTSFPALRAGVKRYRKARRKR